MEYMNMFRNGGQQASYAMPQYAVGGQTVQQQHGQQRYQLQQQQHHQQQQQQQQYRHQHLHNQMQQQQLPPHRPSSQGFSFPYANEQFLVLAQMQQQRTMLDQAQAAANASPQTKQEQPKPRLSKDEVELLEKEFQKNQKPSSGRKREIADILKVDQPRINNWFQNRRAKEKGIKKTQEFAARQAAEQSEKSEASSTRSPDMDADSLSNDYFGLDSQQQHSGRPSCAPFPEPRQETEPADATPSIDESCFSSPVDQSLRPSIEHPECSGVRGGAKEEYPSPESLPFQSGETSDPNFTPHASTFAAVHRGQVEYQGSFPGHAGDMVSHHAIQDGITMDSFMSPQAHDQVHFGQNHFTTATGADSILAPTPSFPSQLLGRFELQELEGEVQQTQEQQSTYGLGASDMMMAEQHQQHSSPDSMPMSPSTPGDLRFKSPPPPSNIASRRNKGVPAQLNPTALRAYSYGPKTGLDLSKRSDAPSPGIRRIASATGSTMAGRVQKSLAAGSIGGSSGAPRSPLFLERTKDALMRSFQNAAAVRSPVMGSGIVGTAASNVLSPMTPSGEYFGGLSAAGSAQGTREPTVASSASDDEQRYSLGAAAVATGGFFGGTLKTPPGTPGLNGSVGAGINFPEHQMAPTQVSTFEAAWNFNPQDEPLVTPGLGSFGSEEFSMASSAPSYVGSSQPPTPSFTPSLGPSSFAGYPWQAAKPTVSPYNGGASMTAHGGAGGMAEYTFPDSFVPDASARSSPTLRSKSSKQFQFTQNVTPQDFSDK